MLYTSEKNNIRVERLSFALPAPVEKESRLVSDALREGEKIIFYGDKNEYFDYLVYLYHNSSKHKAIIDYKCLYAVGDTDDDVFAALIKDYILFGGFALKCLKQNGNIIKISPIPLSALRFTSDDRIAYSENWTTNKAYSLDGFTANNKAEIVVYDKAEKITDGVGIYYYSNTNGYPIPDYSGALRYIELDIRVANFWNSSIRKNFSLGYIVSINSPEPTDEEKKYFYDTLKQLFTGDDNAGTFLLHYSPTGEKSIDIKPLEINRWDDLFQSLNQSIQQEIFIAHKITSPMLLGVRVEGQLGGRNELIDAFNLFYRTIIKPTRSKVLNELKWFNYEVDVQDIKPLDIDISQYKDVLTKNEIREYIGFPPLDETPQMPENTGISEEQVKARVVSKLKQVKREIKGKFEVVASKYVVDGSVEEEIEFARQAKKQFGVYAITYTAINVLKILQLDPCMPVDMLAKAVLSTKSTVGQILDELEKGLYVIQRKNGCYEITRLGKELIEQYNTTDNVQTMIVYSYEWIEGFSDKDLKNSREFCVELRNESKRRMAMGKQHLWTREDIDRISREEGRNVFAMRGGWYRIPGTEISVPHCRHQWKQWILKKI